MVREVYGGLSLAGGKRRGTSLVLLTLESEQNCISLTEIYANLGSTKKLNSDQVLLRVLNNRGDHPKVLGINAPLSLPPCVSCELPWCPGHEICKVNSIEWMRRANLRLSKIYKNTKPALPYTERPIELYLREHFPHWLDIPGAYSANISPLAARVEYLKRHIFYETKLIETLPRLTFYILSSSLGLAHDGARYYRGPESGSKLRADFLHAIKKIFSFQVNERDFELLTLNLPAFDAFLAAATALLYQHNLCEERPDDFPGNEIWVSFPQGSLEVPFSRFAIESNELL
jgi:hypothetical protein